MTTCKTGAEHIKSLKDGSHGTSGPRAGRLRSSLHSSSCAFARIASSIAEPFGRW